MQYVPVPEVLGGVGVSPAGWLCAGVQVRIPVALLALHPECLRLFQISGTGKSCCFYEPELSFPPDGCMECIRFTRQIINEDNLCALHGYSTETLKWHIDCIILRKHGRLNVSGNNKKNIYASALCSQRFTHKLKFLNWEISVSIGLIVFLRCFYDIYNSLSLYPGVLCVLRMCGIYVRHHLPSLHPCPMAVFCRQHLRMGPVCLAHRSVRVLLRASRRPSLRQTSTHKTSVAKFQECWSLVVVCLHAERGVCLPTVSLWILFVYIEAAIRFKDLKNFHVDLCRPFAAHW